MDPQPTEWLWHERVPLGELTVLDGDPGTGKSTVTLDLAARVSAAREMPDGTPGTDGGVLLLAGEDSARKTLLGRLQAAGANLGRIAVPNRLLTVPADIATVEEMARCIGARLIVIDPLMTLLGRYALGDQSVRQALAPLQGLAQRLSVAIVMVRHLTKSGSRYALYRGGGSIGIVAAARSALFAGKDPHDPASRVLAHVKSNLGPLAPSLRFGPVADASGVVRIEWRGECDVTAEDLLSPPREDGRRLDEAKTFLWELLSDGPVEQVDVQQRAVQAGIAYRTVERAKQQLGIASRREGFGQGSTVFWERPS